MNLDISEALDQLPIFPLNTVLFPGAILPLHIFEERYKKMIEYAVDNGNLFGLSYRSNAAIGRETPPEVGSVGCVAQINALMPLESGRMNIVSSGLVRYRVIGFRQQLPFLIARTEAFGDDPESDTEMDRAFSDVEDLCRQFLEAARALDENTAPASNELPEDPESLSLLMSSVLPIENESKQTLLESTSTTFRLAKLKQLLTSALAVYNQRIRIQEIARSNGHGKLNQKSTN
jgi:ATP-dependent Lon protease